MLWNLSERGHQHTLKENDIVHAIAFSPIRFWVCAAIGSIVKIWDLKSDHVDVPRFILADPYIKDSSKSQCISLAWSSDGETLFAGYTDNRIRVWRVEIVPIPQKKEDQQKNMED